MGRTPAAAGGRECVDMKRYIAVVAVVVVAAAVAMAQRRRAFAMMNKTSLRRASCPLSWNIED